MLRFAHWLAVAAPMVMASHLPAEIHMVRHDDRIDVFTDGQLFTAYRLKGGRKPILWPLLGPTGKEMTRAFPMRPGVPGEEMDHVHQRSFWLTHGDVNGVSFWDEGPHAGSIVLRELVDVSPGNSGRIQAVYDWYTPEKTVLVNERQTLVFGTLPDARVIDVDSVLTAAKDRVVFGDTKEGTFGIRVASTMRVESMLGGRIINSDGRENEEAWGKQAKWVDYHGPVDGEILGIAILNHPTSFRFPTYWHVRTYGLFAANPFGLRDFLGDTDKDGSHALRHGESIVLRYRVLLHRGDEKQGKVEKVFEDYARKVLPVR